MPNQRKSNRVFHVPFKPKEKNETQVEDYDSLARTPCTPATSDGAIQTFTAGYIERKVKNPNKRSIRKLEVETPTPQRKSARFTTPLSKNNNTFGHAEVLEKHAVTTKWKRNSVKKDFITPRQTRKSSRIETPVSENTQAKLDYDSLETTPGPVNGFEEKSNLPVPNSSETDKDFDSLGRTPVTESAQGKDVPKAQGDIKVHDGENVDSSKCAGRTQRKRKQTTFFGNVTDSSKADISMSSTTGKRKSHPSSDESDSSGSEAEVPSTRRSTKRTTSFKQQALPQLVHLRRNIEVPSREDRFLETHEVTYHPAFSKHRGWETDGIRAWVKPHPLPLIRGAKFTEHEIQTARNFSPGPPVCPWLVRTTCNGRYPMDEMAVRIALEMRRNFQLSFKKRRRQVERAVARSTRLFTAFRQNIISRTEETMSCLHWKIYQMIKSLRLFTTKNFVDCLDLIAEVYISQFWHPQLRPFVDEYMEQLANRVLKHLDDQRFSPLFMETFKRLGIPYTGKTVIPKGSKVRVFKPGSFPPFLTPKEFEKKFGVYPKIYTDEELTRTYDNVGNVTGHFTVPNLRELLTPLTQQVEEEIEREEEPLRRKQRKLRQWLSSENLVGQLVELKKSILLKRYQKRNKETSFASNTFQDLVNKPDKSGGLSDEMLLKKCSLTEGCKVES
ncbi:hypothetical protein ACHWQZ_G007582 [Mnemiopsis leidyi]